MKKFLILILIKAIAPIIGGLYGILHDQLTYTISPEYKNDFPNKQIIDIITDTEFNGIYFRTENDMILYHNNDFGSELKFEKYSEIFNEKGILI